MGAEREIHRVLFRKRRLLLRLLAPREPLHRIAARNHERDRSAQQRHDQCFSHQLAHESPAAGAYCHAEREFPAPIGCARRKQRCQIRAGCRQDEQSQRSHAVKRTANNVTRVRVESRANDSQRHAGVCRRVFLRQRSRDRTQVFRCLSRRDARLQAPKHR